MELTQLIEELKDHLRKDRIREGIDLLLDHPSLWRPHFDESELIHLSGRLSSLKREQTLGIITPDRYQAERNQLRMILIEKTESLQKKETAPPPVVAPALPDDGDLLIDQASDLFQDGDFQEARAVILRAFGQSFSRYDEAEAYAILGNINIENLRSV